MVCPTGVALQFSAFGLVFFLLGFPFVSLVEPEGLRWAVLFVFLFLKVVLYSSIFTGVMMLINNSCMPSERGAVNGLGQSLVAICRMLGPLCGGSIWSWSNTLAWLPCRWVAVYLVAALIANAQLWLSKQLPESLNAPLDDP